MNVCCLFFWLQLYAENRIYIVLIVFQKSITEYYAKRAISILFFCYLSLPLAVFVHCSDLFVNDKKLQNLYSSHCLVVLLQKFARGDAADTVTCNEIQNVCHLVFR